MREVVLSTIGNVLVMIVVIVGMCVECRNDLKSSKEDESTVVRVWLKIFFKPTVFGIMTGLAFKLISSLF